MTGKPVKWYSFACLPFFIMLICFFSVVLIKELSFFGLDGGFLGEALFYYFETFYSFGSYYYYLLAGLALITFLFLTITFNLGFKNILELFRILKTFIFFIFKIVSKGRIKIDLPINFKIARSSKSNFSGKRSLTSNKKRGIKANKFIFPSIKLLEEPKIIEGLDTENRKNAEINKALLSNVLTDFKISGQITDVKQGPIVTLFN